MSDHRFEKRVGQKLDELKFTPSAKSWENIEIELRKRKRRVVPIFWLPFLLLGLGGIGYFIFAPPSSVTLPINEGSSNASVENKLPVPADETSRNKRWKQITAGEKMFSNTYAIRKDAFNTKNAKHNNPFSPAIDSATEKELTAAVVADLPSGPYINLKGGPSVEDKKSEELIIKKEEQIIVLPKTEPSAAPTPQKKKIKRWAIGISGSGGISSLSEGKIGFSNAQIASVGNRQPLFSFASPAVMAPPISSPSKIHPAFSFSLGLTAKYTISRRFSLSTAVNYLQINTVSKVGYKLEQNYLVNNADMPGTTAMYLPPANDEVRNYNNKYHFVELPVNVHTRINKSAKLPLYVNAGFSISKLIKSNSLHYDAAEHYYYSDDALLSKTQTAVSTGFSVSLLNKRSKPLWIGPTVRYNLSKALKKELSPTNKHFMGLGLDVKWFLK